MSGLVNALGSIALILLGLYLLFRLALHKAPKGCEVCQGISDCEACGPAAARRR